MVAGRVMLARQVGVVLQRQLLMLLARNQSSAILRLIYDRRRYRYETPWADQSPRTDFYRLNVCAGCTAVSSHFTGINKVLSNRINLPLRCGIRRSVRF
jgi:hypothetical protein